MATKPKTFSRGQLAKHSGVKAETIRYYESCGLIKPPLRTSGGHRIYSADDANRVTFIRRCRELGFSLNEISGLTELTYNDGITCMPVRELTADHLDDVQGKIKDLKKMERVLKSMINQCDENTSPDCPIIEALSS
jgi:MerR family mercuric resistance operon transcriptional regulator